MVLDWRTRISFGVDEQIPSGWTYENGRHRGSTQDPGESIPPASIKSHDTSPFLARRDTGPVVDSRRGRNGRGQFSDGGCNGPVEYRDEDEFIEDARGTAVEDGDENRPANCWPYVANDKANTRE